LGDKFEMHVAFSRDGPQKVYVQHKMKDAAASIDQLLQQKAFFYVCGDAANMARDVNALLIKIISEQRGVSEQKAEEIVKAMRASNQYQEDVWS
jgi:NADPH-ferrihemoprotein reductase